MEEQEECENEHDSEQQQEIRHLLQLQPRKQKVYKRFRVRAFLDLCKYNVVHDLCEERHWKECADSDDWNLLWYDWSISNERLVKMLPYQKINHFPGMEQITRKDTLARNMNRCRKSFPELYDFYPATYYIPTDQNEFFQDVEKYKNRVYISKPVASCQGRGIRLFNQPNQIDLTEPQVIQHYLHNPYLINGYKFDLRMYVIVLQVLPYPLILLYDDGMARFCTEKYQAPNIKNLKNTYMHLTNYAINKNNEKFEFNQDSQCDDAGSKQGLQSIYQKMEQDGCDVEQLKLEINDIFLKTIFGILPNLQHSYMSCRPGVPKFLGDSDPYLSKEIYFGSNCFEILGFDIIIDENFKPWLIEVNHSPSFTCDTPLDLRIKETLIDGVMDLLDIQQDDKILYQQIVKEQQMQRLYGKSTSQVVEQRKKLVPKTKSKQLSTLKESPTYFSVMQKINDYVNQSEVFEQIYPLQENEEDIYREIVLNLKNPFIQEQSIHMMNQLEPRGVPHQQPAQQIGKQVIQQLPKQTKKDTKQYQDVKSKLNTQPCYQQKQNKSNQEKDEQAQLISEQQTKQEVNKQGTLHQDADQVLEFGQPNKHLQFRGVSKLVFLNQGKPKNQKLEVEVEQELLNRKRALLKFKLYEVCEEIIQCIENGEEVPKNEAPKTKNEDVFQQLHNSQRSKSEKGLLLTQSQYQKSKACDDIIVSQQWK